MNEITIKQEEVRTKDGYEMRVRLTKHDDYYTVCTHQNGKNIPGAPWELEKDGWRPCLSSWHKEISSAMMEYAERLESLKTRGF